MKEPQIQSKLLGFNNGDRLYVRCLAGKGYDVADEKLFPFEGYLTVGSWEFTRIYSDGRQSVYRDGLDYLRRQNNRGYGIHPIINKGGRLDEEITEATALFYECDDISKDEQWERIGRLPIAPSFVIETRKSLHVYYVLDEQSRSIEGWRKLQQRLIQLMESDRSVHNESRSMRLAGFDHQSKGLKPYPIAIARSTDARYSIADIEQYLPAWDESKWGGEKTDTRSMESIVEEMRVRRSFVSIPDAFPLEACISRANRDLIESGTHQGEASVLGFRLACDLIGAESYLRAAGYSFTGDAESLFTHFAVRTNANTGGACYQNLRIVSQVFESAKRRSPSPALTPEAIENCIKGWQRRNKQVVSDRPKTVIRTAIDNQVEAVKGLCKKLTERVKKVRLSSGLIQTQIDRYYEPGEGARLYEQLAREGHKYILDISPTGSGKTRTVSEIVPMHCKAIADESEFIKLWYIPPSHRNPTNAKIEESFYETPARHKGLFLNYDKFTELGSPYRSILSDRELEEVSPYERTQGTCHNASVFTAYYAAGHDTEGICGGCQYREKCAVTKGDGYGYLSEAAKWASEPRIRTSAQFISPEKIDSSAIVVADEAESLPWTNARQVDFGDVTDTFRAIRKADKELYAKLAPLRDALDDLFDKTTPAPDFGWQHRELMSRLSDGLPEDIRYRISDILRIEMTNRQNPSDIVDGDAWLTNIFLADLVGILTGEQKGSLTASNKYLHVITQNSGLVASFQNAHCAIFQDATYSRFQLASALGIDESQITVICQKNATVENLTIEHWLGMGNLGNNRTEPTQAIVDRARAILADADTGFIEWKKYSHKDDLIHFADARGSNAYATKKRVVSVGIPRPNVTAIMLEYQALTGKVVAQDDENFSRYYNHKIAANILQELGRLRANRRADEQLTYIVLGDGDVSFLQDYGYTVREKDAYDIAPELSIRIPTAKLRYLRTGLKIAQELGIDVFESLSQNKFSKMLERTASAVSQWISRYFGREGDEKGDAFHRFKEMVVTILERDVIDDRKLTEEQEMEVEAISEFLLPALIYDCREEMGQEFLNNMKTYCWDSFLIALRRISFSDGLMFLARIFSLAKLEFLTT